MDITVVHPDGSMQNWTNEWTFECFGLYPSSPPDLSGLFQPGVNHVRITLRDECGSDEGSSPLYFIGGAVFAPGAATNPVALAALESDGWSYSQVAQGAGQGFEVPGYDDSGWARDLEPFNGELNGGQSINPCPEWDEDYGTGWDASTQDLLIRRHFSIPAGATDVMITGDVEGSASVYFNGSDLQNVSNDACGRFSISAQVPANEITAGDNVLALRASGTGTGTQRHGFLDVQVSYVPAGLSQSGPPPSALSVTVTPETGTPTTIFQAAVTGSCPDGSAANLGVRSDTTGQTIGSPDYLVLQDTGTSLDPRLIDFKVSPFTGGETETGNLHFEARCGSSVAASTAFAVAANPFVVLGDSYSAGEGAANRNFIGDTDGPDSSGYDTGCHRSSTGWAFTVTQHEGDVNPGPQDEPFYWTFAACSGAVISNMTQDNLKYQYITNSLGLGDPELPQIDSVSPATKLVVLTMGGNDVGFQAILTNCIVSPPGGQTALLPGCHEKSSNTYKLANQNLHLLNPALEQMYYLIASRMQAGGTLLIAGYPQLFGSNKSYYHYRVPWKIPVYGGKYCRMAEGTLPYAIRYDDAQWIDSLSDRGNAIIAAAISATNDALKAAKLSTRVKFVGNDDGTGGVDAAFELHRQCDSRASWINPLQVDLLDHAPFQTSFHPNLAGQAAYANAIDKKLGI